MAVADGEVQRNLLAWIAWRASLSAPSDEERTLEAEGRPEQPPLAEDAAAPQSEPNSATEGEIGVKLRGNARPAGRSASHDDAPGFHRNVERRLHRWHQRILAEWRAFDETR